MVDREIVTPFGLDASGRIATTANPVTRGRQALLSYLVTSPGERVMRPTWGTQLKNSVFNTFGPVETEMLADTVSQSVSQDVGNVRVQSLKIGEVSNDGVLPVTVEFAMIVGDGTSSVVEAVTINIGEGL